MRTTDDPAPSRVSSFLAGGGEMGALMRAHDWSATALGSPDTWPSALKTSVRLILNTGHPMYIWWGPKLICLYNDAYSRTLGPERHPSSLGRPGREVWAEIWPLIGHEIDHVMAGRGSTWAENRPVPITRFGRLDEIHWTYSYSPIDDEGAPGGVGGVLVVCSETTQSVLAERRQAFRLSIEERLRDLTDPTDVIAAASEALGRHLGAGQVGYAEVEAGGETVMIERGWNDGAMASNAGRHQLDHYGSALIADLRRGETVAVGDVRLDPRTSSAEALPNFSRASIRAFLDVPLVKAGRLVAVLAVQSSTPRAWSPQEVALAEQIAEQTWAAAERARAEASLRAGEERYLALFNAIDQGLCIIEVAFDDRDRPVDYRFLEVSPSFERQTGIANGAGRWMREIAPDQDQHWFDTYGKVALTGEPARFENYSTPLGRWWAVYAFRISGPRRIAVLFRDITEDKRAQTALRESEERLRLAVDNADVGFWDVDVIHDTLTWPARTKAMFGISADVPVTMADFYDGLHPDDREATSAAFAAAADPGRRALYDVEYRTLGKEDGVVRWVAARGRGVFDAAGACLRVAGTAIQITARKEAEDRLRELNETLEAQVAARTIELRRFRDIVEATTSPICAFDSDYRLIAFNKAHNDEFRRVNGFDTKIGDVFPDVFIAEQRLVMRGLMARALSGESFTVEAEFGRPEFGQPSWEITYTPLRDEHGRVIGAFHLATDTSERMRAAAELAAAQEALRESQKMEAIGQLTGGVAHDFNNLLTPIIGSLDMLIRKGIGSERERRLIDGALQSAERAKTLVHRLLAFARRQPLQPVAVDVGRLVGGMAELMGSTLGPTIGVRVDLAPDLPAANADPNQLEMALLNLAVNARDAMPDGGTLAIAARPAVIDADQGSRIGPGRYVRLSVTDAGVGMADATLARAVEPFFSTKGVGKGTGLGLSMVHGLAAQLGGGLTIDSVPGQGTSVDLWLPVSAAGVRTDGQPAPAPLARFGRRKVLLVDDEELVRMSTADMLADLGFEVLEAASAAEALRHIESGVALDLVVTDHVMPGLTGADLARAARAVRPALPVLIVSGYAEAEGIAPELPRLTKPFRNAELAASVAALIPAVSAPGVVS